MTEAAHQHGHHRSGSHQGEGALLLTFALTVIVFVLEVVGSVVFGSLALSADAAHMFSDVVALSIALVASRLSGRPASPKHSFGWRRAEVVAAQINALLLLAVAAWIIYSAVRRFGDSVEIEAGGLVAVALIGLVVNLFSTWLLHRQPGNSLNVRAAALHTFSDALGSFGALAAGVAILVWDADWADAVASILISILVAVAGCRLLYDTTRILLEGTPRHLDVREIERAIGDDPVILAVHHLHVWSLASDEVALSAHLELEGATTLHEAQAEGNRLKAMLADRFGIGHATLELECHPCGPEPHSH